MSTAIDSYRALHYSPLLLAPLIEAFYEAAEPQPKNLLLAYVVLPLALYPESRAFLKSAKVTSSLRTLAKKAPRMYGLTERIREYRKLTNSCVQFVLDMGAIRIEEDLSIKFLGRKLGSSACPIDALRAARNLPKVLKPLNVTAIYRYLGVKRI